MRLKSLLLGQLDQSSSVRMLCIIVKGSVVKVEALKIEARHPRWVPARSGCCLPVALHGTRERQLFYCVIQRDSYILQANDKWRQKRLTMAKLSFILEHALTRQA